MTAPTLFDGSDRWDVSPAGYEEDSFNFLNRAAGPFWARVRDNTEMWFGRYPDAHKPDVCARFRNRRPDQHWSACWELYLHELFTRLGYQVRVHPALPDTDKRPDFLLLRDTERVLVEAAVVFSGIVDEARNEAREAWIKAAIDRVDAPAFSLGLQFQRVGQHRPKDREIIGPIEDWLAEFDPDALWGLVEKTFEVRDWVWTLTANAIAPEHRAKPGHRPLGVGPIIAGFVNDIDRFRATVSRKQARYGEPDDPFVVAVLCASSFMGRTDVEQALFGRHAMRYRLGAEPQPHWVRLRDGSWVGPQGPVGQRVSAVLTATQIHPSSFASDAPELWLHPRPWYPLGATWPFVSTSMTTEGQIVETGTAPDMRELFALESGWPGPEPAFPCDE